MSNNYRDICDFNDEVITEDQEAAAANAPSVPWTDISFLQASVATSTTSADLSLIHI